MRGNPDDATRNRSRATNGRRLRVDLDRGAVSDRGQRSGQSCTAASQHDHVDVAVPVGHACLPFS
jgi:hypothetical protein